MNTWINLKLKICLEYHKTININLEMEKSGILLDKILLNPKKIILNCFSKKLKFFYMLEEMILSALIKAFGNSY